jgi:predicted transposase/invertase (TIGR01784 family)
MLADLNSDERARMEAESREKLRRDIAHYKLDAERKGMAKGMAKGLAEGRLSIARNLLKLGRPVDEVAAATLLSKEEVQSLTHPQMDQATPGKSGGEPDSRIKP